MCKPVSVNMCAHTYYFMSAYVFTCACIQLMCKHTKNQHKTCQTPEGRAFAKHSSAGKQSEATTKKSWFIKFPFECPCDVPMYHLQRSHPPHPLGSPVHSSRLWSSLSSALPGPGWIAWPTAVSFGKMGTKWIWPIHYHQYSLSNSYLHVIYPLVI